MEDFLLPFLLPCWQAFCTSQTKILQKRICHTFSPAAILHTNAVVSKEFLIVITIQHPNLNAIHFGEEKNFTFKFLRVVHIRKKRKLGGASQKVLLCRYFRLSNLTSSHTVHAE